MVFEDREDAGRRLAEQLMEYRGAADVRVLGLPRGGVVVAYEVARALGVPLDVWMVRKIGAPFQPELGMGALAEGGGLFLDPRIVRMVGATEDEVAQVTDTEALELERRIHVFRAGRPRPRLKGCTVILVDDGIATGGTVRAALRAIRAQHPRRIVLAVPVAAIESLESLAREVDETVCLAPARNLVAVGGWYQNFSQTTDAEVVALLDASRQAQVEVGVPSPS